MGSDMLIGIIQHYGYAALFFCLWLGIVGMPIPDEVIVMTGGFVASLGLLSPVPAFFVTYLGVISGLSIGYFLGRTIGEPVLNRLRKKKNIGKYIEKAQWLTSKYGAYSLVISYFFPVVRHIVPYLTGIGRMSYARYALFSYSIGFVWTLVFFVLGLYFGKSIDAIGAAVHQYGLIGLAVLLGLGAIYLVVKKVKRDSQEGSA
jgi:membrane-associated protein